MYKWLAFNFSFGNTLTVRGIFQKASEIEYFIFPDFVCRKQIQFRPIRKSAFRKESKYWWKGKRFIYLFLIRFEKRFKFVQKTPAKISSDIFHESEIFSRGKWSCITNWREHLSLSSVTDVTVMIDEACAKMHNYCTSQPSHVMRFCRGLVTVMLDKHSSFAANYIYDTNHVVHINGRSIIAYTKYKFWNKNKITVLKL